MSSRPALVYAKLAATAMFWGGTFIAGRMAAHVLPPLVAAAVRFGVAAVLLLLLAWKTEGGLPRPNRRELLATMALGATGIFLYNLCFFGALRTIPAGRAALFVALNPTVTALAAAVVFHERLRPHKWAGIALAFLGAAIVITRGDFAGAWQDLSQSIGAGELFMLAAICSWAAYTLIGRRALATLSPVVATTYAALWGLLYLTIGALGQLDQVDWSLVHWDTWAALSYLGAFGTVVGFVWYYEGVRALGPSRAAVFNNLVPVFGVSFAALILGEPVLASMVIGGAVAVAGVTLANR